MNKLILRVGSTIATAATFAAMAVPSFAAPINVIGGGAFSTTGVTQNSFYSNILAQMNNTTVSTGVNANANTGNNSASFNTGGSNGIMTGPAANGVQVGVTGGLNSATAASCGCNNPGAINVVGGGAFSLTGVTANSAYSSFLTQNNSTTVVTSVNTNANTGGNTSSFNTAGGNGIVTGGASNGTTVTVGGSANIAQ